MSTRYHISPSTGRPNQCRATKQCPFGGEKDHYPTKEAAREAYEKQQEKNTMPTGMKRKASKETPQQRYVKVSAAALSPNKTWLLVGDDGRTATLKEVRKQPDGTMKEVGLLQEVATNTIREVKLRARRRTASAPEPSEKPKRQAKKLVSSPAPAEDDFDLDTSFKADFERDWRDEEPTLEDLEGIEDWDNELGGWEDLAGNVCVRCEEQGKPYRLRINPYDRDVHGEENWENLCDDCNEELLISY